MRTLQGLQYLWHVPQAPEEKTRELSLSYSLSASVAHIVVNRGYTTVQDLENFLFTPVEQCVHDPLLLKDAERAVDRIISAIEAKEKILIAGDYDVDGVSSSALMVHCLYNLGAQVNFFLPNRVRDGYGLAPKTVEKAAANNYKVIITVDNGITAFDAAQKAQELGVDLIITDHHRPHEKIPLAYAVVDPCQKECAYPYKQLAGVGVAFKVLDLLYKKLDKQLPEKAYELLLLGTVADVVPLLGENRYWVRRGLQLVNNAVSPALRILKENARCDKPHMSATDIGFALAPQINALGRLEDPRRGVSFLLGEDTPETERIGRVLGYLNEARKRIERKTYDDVERLIIEKHIDATNDLVFIAAHDQWQPGVIGLVASRVVGNYGRPTILLHKSSDGVLKGSCRSIPALNIFHALEECSDLLCSFGGHAMAAGLSLVQENLVPFKERFESIMRRDLSDEDLVQKITVDAPLELYDVDRKLVRDLAYLEPFGAENSRPVFLIEHVTLLDPPLLLKHAHVKCRVFADGVIKSVIFFNRPDIFSLLMDKSEAEFSLIAHVVENVWKGTTSVELQGIDIVCLE